MGINKETKKETRNQETNLTNVRCHILHYSQLLQIPPFHDRAM